MTPGQRGFSLVELGVAAAVAGVLSTLAWPAVDSHLLKARRADATQALMRIQQAQAGHHAAHGLYAPSLALLTGATTSQSAAGHYRLELQPRPDGYVASAQALAGQQRDKDCQRLELTVREGFATLGPTPRCWSR